MLRFFPELLRCRKLAMSEKRDRFLHEGCRKRPDVGADGSGDKKGTERAGEVRQRSRHPRKNIKYAIDKASTLCPSSESHYWLTRIIFLRSLGFVYAVAYLVALNQNKHLLGRNGLLPANLFMAEVKEHAGGVNLQAFTHVPSILWFFNVVDINFYLDAIAMTGFILASTVAVTGAANAATMLVLWVLYHSIVSLGQRW